MLANALDRVPDATEQKRYGSRFVIPLPYASKRAGLMATFGPVELMPFARAAVKDAARRFAVPPDGRHP